VFERHKIVYNLLSDMVVNDIHSLSIESFTYMEYIRLYESFSQY
jgi:stress-induced morphogen